MHHNHSLNRAAPIVEARRQLALPAEARARSPIILGDLHVYTWEHTATSGKHLGKTLFAAKAFAGESGKPLWYHYFSSDAQRDTFIMRTMASRRSSKKIKKERAEKRKQYTPLHVGQILYTSWGYDQTNIDFYEVIAVRGSVVDVQEIGQTDVANAKGHGRGSDAVVPDPLKRGKVLKSKRMQGWEGGEAYINIGESRGSASPWDGQPKYQTAQGYGHAKVHRLTANRSGTGHRFGGIGQRRVAVPAGANAEMVQRNRALFAETVAAFQRSWGDTRLANARHIVRSLHTHAWLIDQIPSDVLAEARAAAGASDNRAAPHRDPRALKAYAAVVYNRLRRKGMSAAVAEHTVRACAGNIRAAKRQGKTTKWVANKCFAAAAFSKRAAG